MFFHSNCDWCGNESQLLREHRDLDEGYSGPIYAVCPDCIHKENEQAKDELNELEKELIRYPGEYVEENLDDLWSVTT